MKKYILKNGQIVEQFVAGSYVSRDGKHYYHLLDSEDSVVNYIRPTLTPKDLVFHSPEELVERLISNYVEDIEHKGQTKMDFCPKQV